MRKTPREDRVELTCLNAEPVTVRVATSVGMRTSVRASRVQGQDDQCNGAQKMHADRRLVSNGEASRFRSMTGRSKRAIA